MSMTSRTLNMRMMRYSPQLLSYDIAAGVTAFSTMRHGGVGEGEYSEFNINSFCGDSSESVSANKRLLAESIGIDSSHIILPHQVHGTEFRIIGPEFLQMPENVRNMILDGVDGVLTSVKGLCIGVSTADCIPVVLYDFANHAACAVHAGWRGTAGRIAQKAVAGMYAAFHSDPAGLKAVVGPGISLDSFEVGMEVYNQFAEAGFDMDAIAKFYDKWHVDLKECNRLQLVAAGVPENNICVSGIDTFTSEDFFSARRQGISSGRIYTAIMLE